MYNRVISQRDRVLKKVGGYSWAPPQNRTVGGFSEGGHSPFYNGGSKGAALPRLRKSFRINEIHRWPETPQMESWHLLPPEKSQVAGIHCAQLQVELFSLPVLGRKFSPFSTSGLPWYQLWGLTDISEGLKSSSHTCKVVLWSLAFVEWTQGQMWLHEGKYSCNEWKWELVDN